MKTASRLALLLPLASISLTSPRAHAQQKPNASKSSSPSSKAAPKQQAKPTTTPNPAEKKPTEAQLRSAFQANDAARALTPPNSQERARAAQTAMQSASVLAWLCFDAKKYDEAATWFERSAALKKEANRAQRARWQKVLDQESPASEAKIDARVAQWETELKTATNPEKQRTLRLGISILQRNRFTIRYGAVTMLEILTREGHDNAAWHGYEQDELKIRRDELDILTKLAAPTNEIDAQKAKVAKALEGVAWAQQELGLLQEAEKNNLEALAIRQALSVSLPERQLDEAYDALGHMYFFSIGDSKKARFYFESALVELEKSTALRLKDWEADSDFTTENRAAMTPKEREDHAVSRADLKVLMLAGIAMAKAKHLANISSVAQESGNYREALDYANRAAQVGATLPPEKQMWLNLARGSIRALALSRLISLHSQSGEMDLALQELKESSQIQRGLGDDTNSATALMQAGRLLYDQGKFEEAKPFVEQARRIYATAQSLDGVVNAAGTMALIGRETGNLSLAESSAAEALRMARKLGLSDYVGGAARTLASIRIQQKRLPEAKTLLDESAAIVEIGSGVLAKVTTFFLQGQLLEAQNQPDNALARYRQAVDLLESVRATASSESNFSNVRSNYRVYERIVRLLIKMGRGEEAFTYLGRAKSKELQNVLSLASIQSQDPKVRGQLDGANALDARLHAIVAQLEAELAKPAAEQSPDKIRNLQNVRAQTQGEFYAVLDELKKTHPNFDVRVEPADIKAVQKRIPADTVLVQYAPLGDQIYVFLFSRTSLKIVEAPGKPDQIWALIKAVRPQLERASDLKRGMRMVGENGAPVPQGVPIEQNLTALYDLLIAPIEADIADKSTLAFIPTQLLYYLPMQALAHTQNGKLRFLIEDKKVVYLATTGQITKAMLPTEAGDLGTGLLAFGDPTGANLPAALDEVNTIGQVFPGSRILSGAQVAKVAVMEDKNWQKRILHFATHGVLDANTPDQSYIQLSPGALASDGELTVREVQALPLDHVDVVTLSACQTAIGQREPGREIMTLAGAFDRAGALSVVASLWSVADDSTKELMVEFYTQLAAGKSKADALRNAQLKVMQNPKFAHPFYWAPFILMGNWR